MDFKVGYDFDGVLAVQPPDVWPAWKNMKGEQRAQKKAWLVTWYKDAPQLFWPQEKSFIVVTARKFVPEVEEASRAWLLAKFPDKNIHLCMLKESRSIENVVKFKSGIIEEFGLTDYTEDNRVVVNALRQVCHKTRIWHFKKGQQILDYQGPQIKMKTL